MAYFAELDENNIVKQVIVVDDVIVDNNEQNGIDFLFEHYGHKNWVQAWIEKGLENPRKFYAGIGYTYDSSRDAFIAPKPEGLTSWSLDETTCAWQAPTPKPEIEGKLFYWDEATLSWVEDTKMFPAYYIDENGETVWR
jgi:hypothetical protein